MPKLTATTTPINPYQVVWEILHTVDLDRVIETAVRCHIPILTIVLNNATMAIYDNSRFPVALEKYDVKRLSGRFAEVAQAMGAYSERITDPQEIVPALKRGLAAVDGG